MSGTGIRIESRTGRAVLMTSHCAGMVDMVALPLWVGTLMAGYVLDSQQAGGLVTLFLIGAVAASAVFAPRFDRHSGRRVATLGFGVAALAFVAASRADDFFVLAALHGLGGFAAGSALSFTHGTIGRSAHPHRLFGLVGMALGVFSVIFLGGVTQAVAGRGPAALFEILAAVMGVACLSALWGFPEGAPESARSRELRRTGVRLPAAVWCGIFGVTCLALVQSMVFSFVERMVVDRGFGTGQIATVLVVVGVVSMLPAGMAALLERRLDARRVVVVGPIAQALLALLVSHSSSIWVYTAAAALMVFTMIFTHTFAFGHLARLDPTGRAVAGTPAMLMMGSAIGPVLGGTIVKTHGYGGLGFSALAIGAIALCLFTQMNRHAAGTAEAVPA